MGNEYTKRPVSDERGRERSARQEEPQAGFSMRFRTSLTRTAMSEKNVGFSTNCKRPIGSRCWPRFARCNELSYPLRPPLAHSFSLSSLPSPPHSSSNLSSILFFLFLSHPLSSTLFHSRMDRTVPRNEVHGTRNKQAWYLYTAPDGG